MAIDAMARHTNIKASVIDYVNANVVTTDEIDVSFPDVPFDETELDAWARLDFLTITPLFSYRRGNSTDAAHDNLLLLQIAFFSRTHDSTGKAVPIWTRSNMRDKVAARFRRGLEITVKDYYNEGNTSVGVLKVRRVSTDEAVTVEGTGSTGVESLGSDVMTVELIYTALDGAPA